LLNHKYRYDIAQYSCINEVDFSEIWKEKYAQGDVCGIYWVAVTRRDLSEKYVHTLFCDIHMLSHLNGGINRREKAECKRLEKQIQLLQEKRNNERRLRKEQGRELEACYKRIKELENKVIGLEKSNTLNKPEIIPCPGVEQLIVHGEMNILRDELARSFQMMEEFAREKSELVREVSYQKKINQQLYEEFQRILKDMSSMPPACRKFEEEMSQCKRRVLMVGGLTRLSSLYQELAEGLGYDFAYHDGYMNAGEKGLKNLIQNVDLVLCSTDCNSHGACNSVKKICKNLNKDCCFLNNTSLSSVSRTLQGFIPAYQGSGMVKN
jgi:hypothetical protein